MTIAQQLEQKGIQKGIQLGEQRIRAIACKMLQRGIDYNMIMELTGLSAEELTPLSD